MPTPFFFDPFTTEIESFVQRNQARIQDLETSTRARHLAPLIAVEGEKQKLSRSIELLDEAFASADARFAEIAQTRSLDPWMSVLRKFPRIPNFPDEWIAPTTLGLIRSASRTEDSTLGKVASDKQLGIVLAYTDEDLLNAFELAFLGKILLDVAHTRRWVSKGARLLPLERHPLNVDADAEVLASVTAYEARRPRTQLLPDDGQLAHYGIESAKPVFVVAGAPRVGYVHEPAQDLYLPCRYLPIRQDTTPILRLLRVYERAIEDIFKVRPEDIVHTLAAFAAQVLSSIPRITGVDGTTPILEGSDGSPEFEHKLRFLSNLGQRGYCRFPRAHLLGRLGRVITPWFDNTESSRESVERFFEAFLVRDGSVEIDLASLRPYPFIYTSPSDEVYVDLVATLDFISWVLERARDWFGNRHGDEFTAALKMLLEQSTDAAVVSWKKHYQNADGKPHEVDLLVAHAGRLYAIECKAMTKSRAFFRGDPGAVQQRSSGIHTATKQALQAAEAVRAAVERGDLDVAPDTPVEWAVCTPTQEYLRPPDKYGFITEGVPRVCTPEELVRLYSEPATDGKDDGAD